MEKTTAVEQERVAAGENAPAEEVVNLATHTADVYLYVK